jgi:hypothetical protein
MRAASRYTVYCGHAARDGVTAKLEAYARFRLSFDNLFKNQYAFVDYRKWGRIELWEGGRFSGPPPSRQTAEQCIEVWHNWKLVGKHPSYSAARRQIAEVLSAAPTSLHDLVDYLDL